MAFIPDVTPGFVPDSPSPVAQVRATPGFVPDKPNNGLAAFEAATAPGLVVNPEILFNPILQTLTNKTNQQRAIEAFSKPATSAPFDQNLQSADLANNLAIGSDFISAPANYLPLPIAEGLGAIGKPIGSLLEKYAPNIAKGLANQTRTLNPAWNNRLNVSPTESNIVGAINTSTPGFVPDQADAYQAWLQKNAQPSTPQNPIMNVPLHPAQEGRAALAQIPEELPGQNGQLGFRDFPQAPEAPVVPPNTQAYQDAIAKYQTAPVRNQGQQQFDFTQGPEAPIVPPNTQSPPKYGLVVANIGADGKVYYGKPGELHFNLSEKYGEGIRKDLNLQPGEGIWKNLGFAGSDGKFLTREEALKVSNIKSRENYLDAKEYQIKSKYKLPTFKNTEEAAAFGVANKDNPQVVQSLQDAYDAGKAKVIALHEPGANPTDEQLSDAFMLAQKNQLYREAVEAAKGIGGFKNPLKAQEVVLPKTVQLPGKQLGFSDIINRKTLKPTPEAPPQLPEEPYGPFRDQGQQQFDFTQGPPKSLKELRAQLLDPHISDADFASAQKQIQDLTTPDHSNAVIEEPVEAPKTNPRDIAKQKLAYSTLKNSVSEYKTLSAKDNLSAVDELRLEDLAANITKLKKLVTPEQLKSLKNVKTPTEPTMLEDAVTILKGLNNKGSTSGGRFTKEGQAAIQRFRNQHAAELAEHLKTTGNTVESFLTAKLPTLSKLEVQTLSHYMTEQKLGTSNVSLHNMSPENAAKAKDIAQNNFVDLAKSTKGERLTRNESIGRAGTQGAQDTAEALSSIDARDAASGMTRLGMEANQALEDIVGKNASPEVIQKANDALEAFKRAGTTAGRLLQSRKNILANAQEFAEQSRILYENGDITKEAMDAIEAGVSSLQKISKPLQEKFWRSLHELGVNNMLSVMSNFRNITGNAIAAPLAPLTRAVQGGLKLAARPVNKLVGALTKNKFKPFAGTDVYAREAGQMVKSYVQNFGTGLKVGGRYFKSENSSAVYRGIQKDIANVTNNKTLAPKAKATKLVSLQKQKAAVLETLRGGKAGDNFAEQGGLATRRAIPGKVGYVINTPVRALAAMDQTFRIPMRQAAEDAIRTRIGIKTGTPWKDVKLTPEQIAEGAHEAAYYTFNQSLGKVGKGIQSASQPTSALGYALGNVLVFMKNAVNIGKFALDHAALQTGSALLDPLVGPLLNRFGQKGTHLLDTKALARSAAGLGIGYTSYALMKKSGMQFYLGTDPNNPDEATERKVAGVPTGVYAKDANGTIHDLSQIYPLTFFFRNMAAWDTAKRLSEKGVEPQDVRWNNFKSQADTFLNASTLTGSKDIMTAWNNAMRQADPSDLPADAVDAGTTYLSKQAAARLTSAFLDEVNRMFLDKTQRDPHTPVDYLEARTPVLSKNVPPKVAWTGQDVKRPEVRSPLAEMTVGENNVKNIDPVNKELLRLGISPSSVEKSQNGVRFTEDERRAIQRKYGPIELDTIKKIIDTPSYQSMPEFMKYSIINDVLKVQHVGEQETAGNHALANMNDYFKLQINRKTKGRSLTGDQSTADIYAGNSK